MDSLYTIIKLLVPNCFMATIDLKDAYYSVPIKASDCKLVSFKWKEQIYQFTCLPNGLSCAPRKFSKILKPLHTCTFAYEGPYICCPFGCSLLARSNVWRLYQECDWNYLATWNIGFYNAPYKVSFGAYSGDSCYWFCHKLIDLDCIVTDFQNLCDWQITYPYQNYDW